MPIIRRPFRSPPTNPNDPSATTSAGPPSSVPSDAASAAAATPTPVNLHADRAPGLGGVNVGDGSDIALDGRLRNAGVASTGPLRNAMADALSSVPANPTPAANATPGIQRLHNDPDFKALYDFSIGRMQQMQNENRGWDTFWQVQGFAQAAQFVLHGKALPGVSAVDAKPLFQRFEGPQERRAICHLLMLMMPESERTERPLLRGGSRGPAQGLFEPFPNEIVARADQNFQLEKGDLPRVSKMFTEHLRDPNLLDQIFRPGQRGTFLASKKYCPGAFLQDRKDIYPAGTDKKMQAGHEGDPIFVKIDDVFMKDGEKYARVHVDPQVKQWMGPHGGTERGQEVIGTIHHVQDTNGKPVLGPDGKAQDILIPVEHLADYLLDPGQGFGARGLDLADSDDRAIALCYTHEIKNRYLTDSNGKTQSLFQWLENADGNTSKHDLDRIRQEVRDAAWHSVAKYACHPRRTHFKIDLGGSTNDWQHEAYRLLNDTGMMSDCGNRYEKDKSNTQDMHELAWTSKFLAPGFVGGSLDCYGLANAFDRLQATFLQPLGILTTTDIQEGHGAELTRNLSNPDENGVVQVGEVYKSKLNEMITAVDVRISSGRGPAAQYMENWPGYLKIVGPSRQRVDLKKAQDTLQRAMAERNL